MFQVDETIEGEICTLFLRTSTRSQRREDLRHGTMVMWHGIDHENYSRCDSETHHISTTMTSSLRGREMPAQPQRPSGGPVLHRSSHFEQSKLSLPSFSFTALCALHIHRPKSDLLPTAGWLPSSIQFLKSSAQ